MAYKRRSDQEWMHIIQECKSSGFSDAEWCQQHNIPISTFYRSLRRLRNKAALDEPTKSIVRGEQEVVEFHLHQEQPKPTGHHDHVDHEVALRLNINGITIEVLNSAAQTTIENTLQSLRSLC